MLVARALSPSAAALIAAFAIADVRLSALLNTVASGSRCGMPATAGASGVVHGAARAELAPAAAERIVAIAGDGDQGLIALAACQSYLRQALRWSRQDIRVELESVN